MILQITFSMLQSNMNRLRAKLNQIHQRGDALLYSVVLMASTLTISAGLAILIVPEVNGVAFLQNSERAFYKAETGVEQVLWQKSVNQNYTIDYPATQNATALTNYVCDTEPCYSTDPSATKDSLALLKVGEFSVPAAVPTPTPSPVPPPVGTDVLLRWQISQNNNPGGCWTVGTPGNTPCAYVTGFLYTLQGYKTVQIAKIMTAPTPGAVKLTTLTLGGALCTPDDFASILGTCYVSLGYIYTNQQPGTIPIYHYADKCYSTYYYTGTYTGPNPEASCGTFNGTPEVKGYVYPL